jgi:hypothetical protein
MENMEDFKRRYEEVVLKLKRNPSTDVSHFQGWTPGQKSPQQPFLKHE